jgi:quinol-cytochrome oxidoreductase complex cytochrome b subunit
MFYYVPTPAEANTSVKAIAYLVSYGWLVRNVHFWAAQGMLVAAFLHLCRVFLTGAAMSRRRFNWLLGLALLGLTLLMDFSGWALRWDQASQWALLVGTNLVKEIPLFGDTLYRWLVGGQAIGAPTLLRFYGWHAVGLPLLASGVLLWHFWRIRRDGGISRARPACSALSAGSGRRGDLPEPPLPGEDQADHSEPAQAPSSAGWVSRDVLVFREFITAGIVLCLLVLLAASVGVEIGPAADLSVLPAEVRAPWFFLGVQGLLRYAPPLQAGILIPLAWLAALAVLPYLEPGEAGIGCWFAPERRPWLIAFGVIAGSMVGLLLWGWGVT